MRSSFALFIALAFICAVLGFQLLSGPVAIVFQISFCVMFVLAALGLMGPKKVRKPVRGSFATSFRSETP